jgi:mannose-6-phosphate isomerase-like protein (cupin superfamily)
MEKVALTVAARDDRGEITDLVVNEGITAITMITFTTGAVRANHVHKHTVQWNYVVSGRIKIVTKLPNEEPREDVLGPGELGVTRENEEHALQALEPSQLLVFTRGPRSGEAYEEDTIRLTTPLILPGSKP